MSLRRARSKETLKSYKQKLAQDFSPKPGFDKKIIWIHAASIGESYSGLSVARIILKHNNDIYKCLKEYNGIVEKKDDECHTSNQERYRLIRNLMDNTKP